MPDKILANGQIRLNIFQMDSRQLQGLNRRLLWTRQKKHTEGGGTECQLSARTLRVRATEWLLLNGLSTLHRFERKGEEGEDGEGDGGIRPASAGDECHTCRQYRVGKAIPIYKELAIIREGEEEKDRHRQTEKAKLIRQNGIGTGTKEEDNEREEDNAKAQRGSSSPSTGTVYATSWDNSTFNGLGSANSRGQLIRRRTTAESAANGEDGRGRRKPSNFLLDCLWCGPSRK